MVTLEEAPSFAMGNMGKTSMKFPVASFVPSTVPTKSVQGVQPNFALALKTAADKTALTPQKNATERALENFDVSYQRLMSGINIKAFNPEKIETYMKATEKRTGREFTKKEKDRIRRAAQSNNPDVIRLLALELRVGIPRKLEHNALAAYGELMMNRSDSQTLIRFAKKPTTDPNLKSHIETVIMMNRVEGTLSRIKEWLPPLSLN